MAATKYTYSVSTDFPNHKVASSRLLDEIRESVIVTAVDYVAVSGDDCDIWFKDQLSSGDKTVLDGLVSVHSGEPHQAATPTIQADGAQQVAIVGREGNETNWATHKFTDSTSWYGTSVRVTEETLADSGDGLTFESDHAPWVDMIHGKVWDEESLCTDVPHGYAVIVTVDDVEKTARKPFAPSGGDYVVDYVTGKVTFAASQTGKVVKASYSYVVDSIWVLRPYVGYALDVEQAELQFSQNMVMTGSIVMAYFGDADHFAPGIFPPGTIIELGRQTYNKAHQLIDEAIGSYPVIGAPLGGSLRGMTSPVYGFPFKYGTVRRLWSKWKMEVRIWLEDWDGNKNVPFEGEHATGTFYCVSREEATL